MPPEVISAIQDSLRQQQSVGGLGGIEVSAARHWPVHMKKAPLSKLWTFTDAVSWQMYLKMSRPACTVPPTLYFLFPCAFPQSAASTVANFLRLPSTIGSGRNLKLFADRLEAMQDLRNRVSG